MNYLSRISLAAILLPLLALGQNKNDALVLAPDLETAVKNVEEKVDQLVDLKQAGGNTENARKEAFTEIIDLLLLETEKISLGVQLAKNLPQRQSFLRQLRANADYFEELKERIKGTISAETLKNIARNLKEWHENSYEPLVKQVNDRLLFLQNTQLLTMAQKRLGLVTSDLKKVHEFKKIKDSPLPTMLKRAADSVAEAEKLHAAAQLILGKESESSNVEEVIKGSLEKIKDAYEIFLEMSELLHRLFE